MYFWLSLGSAEPNSSYKYLTDMWTYPHVNMCYKGAIICLHSQANKSYSNACFSVSRNKGQKFKLLLIIKN